MVSRGVEGAASGKWAWKRCLEALALASGFPTADGLKRNHAFDVGPHLVRGGERVGAESAVLDIHLVRRPDPRPPRISSAGRTRHEPPSSSRPAWLHLTETIAANPGRAKRTGLASMTACPATRRLHGRGWGMRSSFFQNPAEYVTIMEVVDDALNASSR